MKYYSRLQVYKASNVQFNPQLIQATSYNWWTFVKIIKGQIVFNDYGYSNSTRKHQAKVKALMNDLGIKIDVFVKVPQGLQNQDWSKDALSLLSNETKTLFDLIHKKGTKKVKNAERMIRLAQIATEIEQIKRLAA